jgi:hypothetical protein
MAGNEILDALAQPLQEPPPRRRAQYQHTIAFRCTSEQMIAADALRSTFPGGSMSEAFQWFLSSAAGRELISRRIKGEVA